MMAARPELNSGIWAETFASPCFPVVCEYICGLKAVPNILTETAA
jgi:hypothetical protein